MLNYLLHYWVLVFVGFPIYFVDYERKKKAIKRAKKSVKILFIILI